MAAKSRQNQEVPPIENETPDTTSEQVVAPSRKWWRRHPVRSAALVGLLLFGLILAIPQTRYPILGAFLDRSVRLQVVDAQTGKPVSAAEVTRANVSDGSVVDTTDSEGVVWMELPVGKNSLSVKKPHYADGEFEVFVGLSSKDPNESIGGTLELTATGRQVAVAVTDRISGKPIKNVELTAGETVGISDDSGKATLVVPSGSEKIKIKLSPADAYNGLESELTVSESPEPDKANQFTLTPAGKVYFLSKRSGRIDVVKSDLDGTNRKVVLKGTGKESDSDTVLLASRDWKYLALKSKRDGGKYPKLFLIDTSNDSLAVIDQGSATFTPVGWSNHYFVYDVGLDTESYKPGSSKLKSYDASARKIILLASSRGEGSGLNYFYEYFKSPTILSNGVLYSTNAYACCTVFADNKYGSKPNEVVFIKPSGEGRQVLLSRTSKNTILDINLYELDGVYISASRYNGPTGTTYYEYESGDTEPKVVKIDEDEFNKPYPTFLVSPGSQRVFWAEPRDGKNALFVGTTSAEEGVQVDTASEYDPYGWFTDQYVLVSKDGSELYIRSTDKEAPKPVKITDYHKPEGDFEGYGYGYGGL